MAEQMIDERLLTPEERSAVFKAYYSGKVVDTTKVQYEDYLLGPQLAKADKVRPTDREKIIRVFGCQNCVALEDCLTDEPMNFCVEKRRHLKGIISLLSLLNPEAIRREVAEEIIKEVEDGGYVILLESGQALVASTFGEWWQSLKSRLGGGG